MTLSPFALQKTAMFLSSLVMFILEAAEAKNQLIGRVDAVRALDVEMVIDECAMFTDILPFILDINI
jgi:hypothetical protein